VLPRASWPGGSGFAAQGPGRALAPVDLVAPGALVLPRKTGPGLRFLPRNFLGWPWIQQSNRTLMPALGSLSVLYFQAPHLILGRSSPAGSVEGESVVTKLGGSQ
jgi:hypothetical protein